MTVPYMVTSPKPIYSAGQIIKYGDCFLADPPPAAYDSNATYAVGDYCSYGGVQYVCSTIISTGEAWTVAHWTAKDLVPVDAIATQIQPGQFVVSPQSVADAAVGIVRIGVSLKHFLEMTSPANTKSSDEGAIYAVPSLVVTPQHQIST